MVRHYCSDNIYRLCNATFLSFIAYNVMAAFLYIMYKSKVRLSLLVCALISIILVAVCFAEGYFDPNSDKYAPQIQYILYGLLVTSLLLVLTKKTNIHSIPKTVYFFSANSLWIYLWHILILKLMFYYPTFFPETILNNWCLKWIFVVFFASGITWIQNLIMCKCQIINNR